MLESDEPGKGDEESGPTDNRKKGIVERVEDLSGDIVVDAR